MTATGSPYRAAVVKRRPAPVADAPMRKAVRAAVARPTAEDRAAEIAAEHANRVAAEVTAVRRIESMTRAWNDELSSTVPAVASVVSRAVRSIVGEAPREDVVMNALRREVARVRGEHRPVLRVSREDGEAWTARLRERATSSEPAFDVRPDDALPKGKCLLEIGARRVELTPEAQLDAFDDHLRNGVGAIAPRPAPALPDVPAPVRTAEPAATDDTTPITVDEPKPARRTLRRSIKPATRSISRGNASDGRVGDEGTGAATPIASTDMRRETAKQSPSRTIEPAPSARAVPAEAAASPRPVRTEVMAEATPDRTSVAQRKAKAPNASVDAASQDMTPASVAAPVTAADRAERGRDGLEKSALEGDERMIPAKGQAEQPVEAVTSTPAHVSAPSGAERRPANATSAGDSSIDFDALDLGDEAARFESGPSVETGAKAPWIGSVVAAPALADVGIEGGGSRAVAALRERVARTAGDLRREVTGEPPETGSLAEALASNYDVVVRDRTARRSNAGREQSGAERRSPTAPGAAAKRSAVDGAGTAAPIAAEHATFDIADDARSDDLPPFAHRARMDAAARAPAPPQPEILVANPDDMASVFQPAVARAAAGSPHNAEPETEFKNEPDDRVAVRGNGDTVRAALAGARRRGRAERPAVDRSAQGTGEVAVEAAPAARESRLPPRIAELIAKRRPAR